MRIYQPLAVLILISFCTTSYGGIIQDEAASHWVSQKKEKLFSHFPQPSDLTDALDLFPLRNYLAPKNSRGAKRAHWAEQLNYGDEDYFNVAFHRAVDVGHYGFTGLGWSFSQLMAFLEYTVLEINYRRANSAYAVYGVRRDLSVFTPVEARPTSTEIFSDDLASMRLHLFEYQNKSEAEQRRIDFNSLRDSTVAFTYIGLQAYKHASLKAQALLPPSPPKPNGPITQFKKYNEHIARFNEFINEAKWSIFSWKDANWHITRGIKPEASPIPLTLTISIPKGQVPDLKNVSGPDGNDSHLIWLHTPPFYIDEAMRYIETLFLNSLKAKSRDKVFKAIARIHWWIVQTAPYFRGPGTVSEMLINIIAKYHHFSFPEWKDGVAPSTEILTSPDEEQFASEYLSLLKTEPGFEPLQEPVQADTREGSDYQNALSHYLEQNNLTLQATPADGNCFLHALAAQTGEDVYDVRKRLIERVKQLIDQMQPSWAQSRPTASPATNSDSPLSMSMLYSLLEQLERGTWVDVAMVYVVAEEYQRRIHLTHPNHQAGNELLTGYVNSNRNTGDPELNFIFINGNHWTWTRSGNPALLQNHLTFTEPAKLLPASLLLLFGVNSLSKK